MTLMACMIVDDPCCSEGWQTLICFVHAIAQVKARNL